jgi:hypothetical protein
MSLARFLYSAARAARDGEAVGRAIATGSPRPIMNRVANRMIGRYVLGWIGRQLWMR